MRIHELGHLVFDRQHLYAASSGGGEDNKPERRGGALDLGGSFGCLTVESSWVQYARGIWANYPKSGARLCIA